MPEVNALTCMSPKRTNLHLVIVTRDTVRVLFPAGSLYLKSYSFFEFAYLSKITRKYLLITYQVPCTGIDSLFARESASVHKALVYLLKQERLWNNQWIKCWNRWWPEAMLPLAFTNLHVHESSTSGSDYKHRTRPCFRCSCWAPAKIAAKLSVLPTPAS